MELIALSDIKYNGEFIEEDEIFEADDRTAKQLVDLGSAREIKRKVKAPAPTKTTSKPKKDVTEDSTEPTENDESEDTSDVPNRRWKKEDIANYARENGIEVEAEDTKEIILEKIAALDSADEE